MANDKAEVRSARHGCGNFARQARQGCTRFGHRDETPTGFGYAVFGKVVNGMDVVKKIAAVPTATKGPYQNVPVTPVVIESIRVMP